MLLMMGVSLYTVKVVLNTLGAVDYGIYNVVGGVVSMFSFLSGTMASASQRFFAFELGRKNYEQLKKTFSMTMTIYAMIAVVILILSETVGLWFLNTRMTIPPERMEAANCIYQFSILSFMMTMFTVPYNASIIAHERMNVYAWVSIIEVVLKLAIVYILVVFSADKLKLYAVLTFSVTTLVTLIYRTYCKRKFEECRFSFCWDKKLLKEIINYSGWSLLGNSVSVVRNQGISILMNIFFNPVVNAAQAIATQINVTLMNFTNNFYTAVRPQIVKNYSSNNINELSKLIYSSAKYAYYLMFLLSIPIIFETQYILGLWLKNIPQYTVIFTQIIIINTLIEVINSPIIATIQATGNLKWYQLTTATVQLLLLPLAYICYKFNLPPYCAYYVMILLSLIGNVPRLIIFHKITSVSAFDYLKKVILNICIVSIIAIIPLMALYQCFDETFLRMFLVLLYDLFIVPIIIYFVGLERNERTYIIHYIHYQIENK
jgi:O-antigen/teichoic acid export membrane protein